MGPSEFPPALAGGNLLKVRWASAQIVTKDFRIDGNHRAKARLRRVDSPLAKVSGKYLPQTLRVPGGSCSVLACLWFYQARLGDLVNLEFPPALAGGNHLQGRWASAQQLS